MALVLLFAPLIHTFFGGLPELGHTRTLTHFKKRREAAKEKKNKGKPDAVGERGIKLNKLPLRL